jgi:hypothetical protein
MPKFRAHSSLLLVSFAIAAGTGAWAHTTSPDGLHCEVRSRKSADAILLEAVVTGKAQATGEYAFVISKSGGGGTSDITQGGEFEIGPEGEASLGEARLGTGEASSIRAKLRLTDNGKLLCEAQFRN